MPDYGERDLNVSQIRHTESEGAGDVDHPVTHSFAPFGDHLVNKLGASLSFKFSPTPVHDDDHDHQSLQQLTRSSDPPHPFH